MSFCVVVANAFAVTPVVNCPLLPTSLLPIPESKEVWGPSSGGREGQKGVLQHNQTPVSLVATPNLAVSTYPNCSIERVDEQSYHVWPPWGEACSQRRCSAVRKTKAKFKFPQSLLEPLLKLLGSRMFGEPGSGERQAVWPWPLP